MQKILHPKLVFYWGYDSLFLIEQFDYSSDNFEAVGESFNDGYTGCNNAEGYVFLQENVWRVDYLTDIRYHSLLGILYVD